MARKSIFKSVHGKGRGAAKKRVSGLCIANERVFWEWH
jgi:hypothetical protein